MEKLHNVKDAKRELNQNSLYEPYFEKDNCGMGFIANIENKKPCFILLFSFFAVT